MKRISRRGMLQWSLVAAAGLPLHASAFAGETSPAADIDGQKIKDTTFQFIAKCARNDGGYSVSLDPEYKGSSDTAESDLAAVTYAATLSKPEGRTLTHAKKSVDFIQHHQQAGRRVYKSRRESGSQVRPCHPLQHGSGRRWTARLGSNAASESRPRNGSILPEQCLREITVVYG